MNLFLSIMLNALPEFVQASTALKFSHFDTSIKREIFLTLRQAVRESRSSVRPFTPGGCDELMVVAADWN